MTATIVASDDGRVVGVLGEPVARPTRRLGMQRRERRRPRARARRRAAALELRWYGVAGTSRFASSIANALQQTNIVPARRYVATTADDSVSRHRAVRTRSAAPPRCRRAARAAAGSAATMSHRSAAVDRRATERTVGRQSPGSNDPPRRGFGRGERRCRCRWRRRRRTEAVAAGGGGDDDVGRPGGGDGAADRLAGDGHRGVCPSRLSRRQGPATIGARGSARPASAWRRETASRWSTRALCRSVSCSVADFECPTCLGHRRAWRAASSSAPSARTPASRPKSVSGDSSIVVRPPSAWRYTANTTPAT